MRKEISEFARHKAAQAWCTPETEKIVMIPELADAFAAILDELLLEHKKAEEIEGVE